MRSVAEQPRLLLARLVGAFCLIAAGIAIGGVFRGGDTDAAQATQLRLVSVTQSAREQRAELQRVNAELVRAVASRTRAERALRDQRRVDRRLRRELKVSRRAARARKRQ